MTVIDASAEPVETVGEPISIMSTLCDKGDTQVHWDRRKPDEVAVARAAFEAMQAKKYFIYSTKADGTKAKQIRTFDPDAERIIGYPQPVGG